MAKSLMQMLVEAGYPREDIDYHESDLYVYITPLTTKVLEEWCKTNGWNPSLIKQNRFVFDIFKDNITGRMMYDCAFQYFEE